MGKILVTRKQEWNNRLRQIGIYVDGQKVGTIANGETKTFDVPDGSHSIRAKIDWCGSREIEFSVSGDQKKYFALQGFKYGNIIFPLTLAIVVLNIVLRKLYNINYISWLIIIPFVIVIYYLTIGRNDYLRLEETDTW